MGLGYTYLAWGGKEKEAEQAFKDYLRLIKPKSEVYEGLGHIYITQQRYSEAEGMFKKSLEISEKMGGYIGLGRLYLAMGKKSEASVALQKAIETNPGDSVARQLLESIK